MAQQNLKTFHSSEFFSAERKGENQENAGETEMAVKTQIEEDYFKSSP